MKTSNDPRHKKRQAIIQQLFAISFQSNNADDSVKDIVQNLPNIDATVSDIAPEFPIDKINKVDLAILRLAVYEMNIKHDAPSKVVIDEAIELAKEFGGDASPAFINGALGKLAKEMEKK